MAVQKKVQIEAVKVERMAALLARESPEEVQDRLGIGTSTWIKVRRGEAIRQSVAVRLLERLQV